MIGAIARDGVAQRALFDGDAPAARAAFAQAADLYRRSREAAPAESYGRLVGMLKSAVLDGGGEPEADYVDRALGEAMGRHPPDAPSARRWVPADGQRVGTPPHRAGSSYTTYGVAEPVSGAAGSQRLTRSAPVTRAFTGRSGSKSRRYRW